MPLDPVRLSCLLESAEGSYHRQQRHSNLPPFPFSAENVTAVMAAACQVDAALRGAGQGPLPLGLYAESMATKFRFGEGITKEDFRC